MRPRNIAIVGAEKEVMELCLTLPNCSLVGVFDPNPNVDASGVRVFGGDDQWHFIKKEHPDLRVVIALDSPNKKTKLAAHYGAESITDLVSTDSWISSSATYQQGIIMQRGVKVFPNAQIGICCKLNSDSVIHHDCVVGDFCTLAPGSRLLGNVKLLDRVFIGAGAIVLQRVVIGEGSVVGAGAVVVEDVPPGLTVVGVPAKPIRRY